MSIQLVTKLSNRQCFTLTEKDTLKTASEKLQKHNVGVMPVLREQDKNELELFIREILLDIFIEMNSKTIFQLPK